MTKHQFLSLLQDRLSGLPRSEAEERLRFYSEMIEDRIEEGLTEEEAVSAVGSVDGITQQITAETPAVCNALSKRRLKSWEIALLALGSPLWLCLLIAAFAIVFSLYVSLWAVIISLWAVFVSTVACTFGITTAGAGFCLGSNSTTGMAMIGAGIVCAGLSIFLFFGCKTATNGALLLTKKIICGIKRRFTKKEAA